MKKAVLSMVLLGAANFAFAATSTSTSLSASEVAAPTASVSAAATEVSATTQSKWKGSVYASTLINTGSANRGNIANGQNGDAYVQFKRKLENGRSLSLRAVFLRDDGAEELAFFDPYVIYTFSEFMGSTIRTNIPMSAWSRDIGRHELRYDGVLELAKSGKTTLSLATNPRAYYYSQKPEGQVSFRWQNDLALSYELSQKALAYFEVGYEARWYNSGAGQSFEAFNAGGAAENPASNRFKRLMEIGFEFTPVEGLWVATYLLQGNNRVNQFKFLNDEETGYMFEVSAEL